MQGITTLVIYEKVTSSVLDCQLPPTESTLGEQRRSRQACSDYCEIKGTLTFDNSIIAWVTMLVFGSPRQVRKVSLNSFLGLISQVSCLFDVIETTISNSYRDMFLWKLRSSFSKQSLLASDHRSARRSGTWNMENISSQEAILSRAKRHVRQYI